jgi:hypothetical protein
MDATSSVPRRAPIESPVAAPSNAEVADLLERVARSLVEQRASADRALVWSAAASEVRALDEEVRDIKRARGLVGLYGTLEAPPRIATAVDEIVRTRGLALLARLEGDLGPDPICTPPSAVQPPVAVLLEVDALFRARAARGELPRIAPRRFNRAREAWLPVLHVDLCGFCFTAMSCNTARAHRLGLVQDWVVVFAERGGVETQHVVLTERRGPRAGRRVVRSRESENAELPSARL